MSLYQLIRRFPRRIVLGPLFDFGILAKSRGKFLIDFSIIGVFIDRLHNRADRAFRKTGPAVDAGIGVDDHKDLALILSRVNAIDRTDGHANAIALPQTFFSNHVRQCAPPQ